MEKTLLVLAAGLGSRFGGNKQISCIGPQGEFLMEYSIHDAIEAGFNHIVWILKEEMIPTVKERIGDRLPKNVKVDYAVQDYSTIPSFYKIPAERTKPFGTVHAVLAAKDYLTSPFATINADDYYGKEAYKILSQMLETVKDDKTAVMVPYILGNTMSENGGVTRGVCSLKNNVLCKVCETSNIHYGEKREITSDVGKLDPAEMVSMNIWGFHQSFLPVMDEYFKNFLKNVKEGELKAECLLPVMVNDLLQEKKLTVYAKSSPDRWFGITYQADRDSVAAELQKLQDQGVYPKSLY